MNKFNGTHIFINDEEFIPFFNHLEKPIEVESYRETCPDVYYTNKDRLEELTLEETTIFLNRWAEEYHAWRTEYGETKAWLQEPFDGWIDWKINN